MKTFATLISALLLLPFSLSRGMTQEIRLDDKAIARLAEVLSGKKLDTNVIQTRGRGEIFSKYLSSVPLVISAGGTGSSAVIHTSSESTSLVVTNHHVVNDPFTDNKGSPFVLLVFYNPQLASEPFDRDQIGACGRSQKPTGWCNAFQQSLRPALVIGTDPSRDLALLLVQDAPKGAAEIALGQIDAVKPGDDVFVVGHPFDLLWSLTTGVVSAVRKQFPTGNPPYNNRATVIQTQTPVNPGNSGGPMMNQEGRLVGLIFAQRLGQPVSGAVAGSGMPGEDIRIAAPGINFAIGVNEVQSLLAEFRKRLRK